MLNYLNHLRLIRRQERCLKIWSMWWQTLPSWLTSRVVDILLMLSVTCLLRNMTITAKREKHSRVTTLNTTLGSWSLTSTEMRQSPPSWAPSSYQTSSSWSPWQSSSTGQFNSRILVKLYRQMIFQVLSILWCKVQRIQWTRKWKVTCQFKMRKYLFFF